MNNRLECYIVQDLLPSYIDNLTNEKTHASIQKHLESCKECRTIYDNMKASIPTQEFQEIREVRKILGKTKKKYLLKGISSICILSILISLIVNIAVSHHLSWFYIVTGGVVLGGSFMGLLLFKEKNKLFYSTLSLSIMIIPYLLIIEYVMNNYYIDEPIYWVKDYALPITAIWLIVIWSGISVKKIFSLNTPFCLAITSVVAIPGSILTNWIIDPTTTLAASIATNWIAVLSCGLVAIVCFILGIIINNKK